MTPERLVDNLGEVARPFSIIFLVIVIGVALFVPLADATKLTIVAGVFGVLIGARSLENQVKMKTESANKIASGQAASEDKRTEAGLPPVANVGPNDQVVIGAATTKKGG